MLINTLGLRLSFDGPRADPLAHIQTSRSAVRFNLLRREHPGSLFVSQGHPLRLHIQSISPTCLPIVAPSFLVNPRRLKHFKPRASSESSKIQTYSFSEHHALSSTAKYTAITFAQGSAYNEELNMSVCQQVRLAMTHDLSTTSSHQNFQLILGGKCCMLPATLSAFWQYAESHFSLKRVGLIYIDADGDLASPIDPSFIVNLAGMNMTYLIQSHGALPGMNKFSRPSGEPVCNKFNTDLFGINMCFPGNKPEHFDYLFDNGYKLVSSASGARGPEERAKGALEYVDDRSDIIIVHFDVDSVNEQVFTLTNLPNIAGVRFEEMMRALRGYLDSDKVVGLTVAEANPDHDPMVEMIDRLANQIMEMLGARN